MTELMMLALVGQQAYDYNGRGPHVGNEEGRELSYNEAVGQRLRSIRKQRGLSLQDVEEISSREFKASVLGAYERGERALSLPRLQRLAAFFNVSPGNLLPQEETGESAPITALPVAASQSISTRSTL